MREKIWTKHFIVVCMISFLMFLTLYMTATTFPLYINEGLHGNQQQMGLSLTVNTIGSILIRPFSGQWVDRFGKKKMAVIGLGLSLVTVLCYFGSSGILIFFAIRLIHGMCYAIASTATSAIAFELVPASREGEGMGYYNVFMSVAMVIGPALGLSLYGDNNYNLLIIAVTIVSLLALFFTISVRIPQQKQQRPRQLPVSLEPSKKSSFHWSKFIELKALPISLAGFILGFSYSSITGFIPSFTVEIKQTHFTSYFFIVFALMIIISRPLIGKIFDNYNEHYLVYPGIFAFSLGMLLLSQAHSGVMVLVAGTIIGLGFGALLPSFQILAMTLSPAHHRGLAIGTFFLLFDSGYAVGSYSMGLVASLTNYRTMYVCAGLTILVSVAVYYLLHHRPKAKFKRRMI